MNQSFKMEYLSLCRTCLTENLGDEFGTIYDFCENDVKFSEILQLIAPQIDLADESLTKIICNDCINQFREINRFREQILSSNHALKKESSFEEIIEYPMDDEHKLQDTSYTLVEIEPTESNLMLAGFPSEEMIVEETIETEELPEEHIKSQSPKSRSHICIACNKKFTTASKLMHHEIIHSDLVVDIKTENENRCMICDVQLESKSEFEKHLKDHKAKMENETLNCDRCGKSFEKFSALCRHLKLHNENKVRNLNFCRYNF